MARDKLNPNQERARHYNAYEIFRDLGHRRSFREVARRIGSSPQTISKWAKLYHWEERLVAHKGVMEEKKAAGALVKIDDPVVKKMNRLLEQAEALIDSVFLPDGVGKLSPTIKITNAKELTDLIAEYRRILESYYKFVAEFKPEQAKGKRGTTIDKFNVIMGDMSQSDRIDMMRGMLNENEPRGDKQSPGKHAEADYTEVSGRGDEDRSGRD